MKRKYLFVVLMLAGILAAGSAATGLSMHWGAKVEQGQEFTVVTSFYPMYIAACNIIGDAPGVTLTNLSEPKTGCLHDYQLTPEDMKLLSTADVFLVNGGGIESFLSDVAAAYPDLQIIEACEGIPMDGDNAHVWMSISLYRQQVENIARGLQEADQAWQETTAASAGEASSEIAADARADLYGENAAAYLRKLEELEAEAAQLKAGIQGGEVVLFQEGYGYLAADLGLETVYVMDLDEERQISAGEVADVIRIVREQDVPVIFADELYGKDMGEAVEKETDVKVVYLDMLVSGGYEADSYLTAMEQNLQVLKEAYRECGKL